MGESPSFLSNLGGRYELLTAGITFAAFVGFAKSVPAGFHISNRNMMKSGMLFSFACASYYWHRGGTQATYGGESQSLLKNSGNSLLIFLASAFWR